MSPFLLVRPLPSVWPLTYKKRYFLSTYIIARHWAAATGGIWVASTVPSAASPGGHKPRRFVGWPKILRVFLPPIVGTR